MSSTDRPSGVRRLAGAAGNAAVVVVTLVALLWILPGLLGFDRYVITGGSMTGTFDKGSVVFEKRTPVGELRVGDVITYLPPADSGVQSLVTHRITRIEPAEGGGRLFSTKGDANPDPDPWHFELVDTDQPVAAFGVPHAGWVFIALADRDARLLLVGGPAALVGLFALGELVAALRQRSPDDVNGTGRAVVATDLP